MDLLLFTCKNQDIILYCLEFLKGLNQVIYVKKLIKILDTYTSVFLFL